MSDEDREILELILEDEMQKARDFSMDEIVQKALRRIPHEIVRRIEAEGQRGPTGRAQLPTVQ